MKIALCLYGQIRGVNSCLDSLIENVTNPWEADVFLCFNNSSQEDLIKTSKKFNKVIKAEIYENEDLNTCFSKSFYKNLIEYAKQTLKNDSSLYSYDVNFLAPLVGSHSALLARMNWFKLAKMIENYINEYDYFLITRPDHFYTFPIFNKSFLNSEYIFKYDGHDWGGINSDFLIIPSNIVLDWLNFNKSFLNDEQYVDYIISGMEKIRRKNSEYLTKLMFDYKKWNIKTLSMNSFISSDSPEDKTTYQPIKSSEEHIWKYDCQFSKCLENYNLWQNGYVWKNFSDKISLEKI